MKKLLYISTLIIVTCVWSCDKSKKMCGVYVCKEHYDPNMVNSLKLDINIDGSIELKSKTMNSRGTYQAIEDSIFIKTDFFDMHLQVKGDSLIGWSVLYVKSG